VPACCQTLKHEDLWLRIKAAEALAAIGEPAMVAVPEMLEQLARVDKENDPRGMQQRYFAFALFNTAAGCSAVRSTGWTARCSTRRCGPG
jgi:HEAT repeat protein